MVLCAKYFVHNKPLRMIRNYVKVAGRNLLRHPSTSVIHVLGLSLGIVSCLLIFLVIRFELGFDTFEPDNARIYRVTTLIKDHLGGEHQASSIPAPAAPAIRSEFTGLSAVTFFHTWAPSVTIPGKGAGFRKFDPIKTGEQPPDIVLTDPDYFAVFPYQWLVGNPAAALTEPFHVVLTESRARRYFGNIPLDRVLGREIIYEDSLQMTVSGIVKDLAGQTDLHFNDFISFATVSQSFLRDEVDMDNWGMWSGASQTFIKLAPGVSLAQVERQAPGFTGRHINMRHGDKATFRFQPLRDLHFNGDYHDSYSRQAHLPTLYGLMGIALFILVIACINFINLSTAQSVQRAKEIGVRKVLGSGRRSLVIQFLAETALLTLLAVTLSLLLVRPLLAVFHDLLPDGVPVDFLSPSTLLFLGAVLLVTTLGAGFYPARVLSSFLPVLSLKGQGATRLNRKSTLRRALIVFQFTFSLVFIIGAIVVGRQIRYMLNTDLGFDKDAIVNIQTNRHYTTAERTYFAQLVRQVPGVSRISLNAGTPSSEHHSGTSFTYKGKAAIEIRGEFFPVDTGYLGLYHIPLLAGRNLFPCDTMKELLVNETGARALGFRRPEDAIGRMVECGMSDTRSTKLIPIVGVVADFHSQSLHAAIQSDFLTTSADNCRLVSVKLDTKGQGADRFTQAIRGIGQAWKQVYPDEKFDYVFFDDAIARFYKNEQKTARIIQTAMTIAIFISCMGLFGLSTFSTQQRTKEIGIRRVMGATVPRIVALLCTDFVALVGLSIVIASPLAWLAMHRWLQDYAYRVSISGWVFVLSGLAAIAIALVTVGFQALRVARANPVESLRTE